MSGWDVFWIIVLVFVVLAIFDESSRHRPLPQNPRNVITFTGSGGGLDHSNAPHTNGWGAGD